MVRRVNVASNTMLDLQKCVWALVTRVTQIGNNSRQINGFNFTKKLALKELAKAEINVFVTHNATGTT